MILYVSSFIFLWYCTTLRSTKNDILIIKKLKFSFKKMFYKFLIKLLILVLYMKLQFIYKVEHINVSFSFLFSEN